MDDSGLAQTAAVFWIFSLGQVAQAGAAAQNFARAGDLKPFGYGLSGFDAFGSSHKFLYKFQKGAYYTLPAAAMQERFSIASWQWLITGNWSKKTLPVWSSQLARRH
jgi:hypothetical protein